MKSSLLIQVLYKLDATEIAQFKLFMVSPFFKQPPHIDKLFTFLMSKYPDNTAVSKEVVFQHCFPDKMPYDALLMNNTIAKLLQQLELFLAHHQLQEEDLLQNKLTINAYKKKNLYPVFKKRSVALSKKLEDAPFKEADIFLLQFQNNFDLYFHPATSKSDSNEGPSISLMSDQLDCYYMMTKMKLALESRARHQIFVEEKELFFLTEAIDFIQKRTGVLFQLYTSMYELLSQPVSEKNFDKVCTLFLNRSHHLPQEQQATLLVLLLNKINLLVTTAPNKYRPLHHQLHKFGIDQELFTQNGFINGSVFFNIVTIAAIVGEFRFAMEFMKSKSDLLELEIKSDVLLLSQCFLYFHQGKIKEADKVFQTLPFKNKQYKLLANSLHFRCMYEMALLNKNNESAFQHFANNFVKHLHRNPNLNKVRRDTYLNMIKITRLLIQTKHMSPNKKNTAILKIQQLLKEPVVAKEWLFQKLANI